MRTSGVALLALGGALCAMATTGHAAAPSPAPQDPSLALAALDRKIADLDATEQSDKQEIARIGAELGAEHARVLVRGRAYYKLTRAGLLPVGGGFTELVSYAMRVERARRLLEADVTDEAHLRTRAGDLARELERVARDRVALASQRTEMDAARLAMEDERRRQAAFDKAFESSTGSADYVAVYGAAPGAGAPSPSQPLDSLGATGAGSSAGFPAARGHMLFPVAGRAEVRAAHREGTDGPGLEIRAPVGAVVRAVYPGRVAFADRYGPYGRIVILDHGDHYYSVSGDLDEIDVKIGQDVGAGDRIGTVGDDGQGPMLYFEVRHGAQTIAPGPWLGL